MKYRYWPEPNLCLAMSTVLRNSSGLSYSAARSRHAAGVSRRGVRAQPLASSSAAMARQSAVIMEFPSDG